eukprot:1190982-Prorocentrum_minimum.AAC.1
MSLSAWEPCVTGTNHRGATGYIPKWGPIAGEPPGIYLNGDQSQGSQLRPHAWLDTATRPPRKIRGTIESSGGEFA